jgi:hypothetical protein
MHAPSLESKSGVLKALGLLAVLIVLMTLANANAAWADTFTVTNTKDSGAGSLRAAIKGANYSVGADEIAFADGVGGTITLASPLPTITDPEGLTIDGGGDVTVSGNHAVWIFLVTRADGDSRSGNLTLRNLTIADGFGAGTIINPGTLTVTNSTFSGNSGGFRGGAIDNEGGLVTVTNSTFSDNSADFGGGAIFNRGTLRVTNSTFSGNHAADIGGALFLAPGEFLEITTEATITNTTFSGNSASSGGAIFRSTRFDDDSGFSVVTLSNTIVADSPSGGNCSGDRVGDSGYNVEDTNTCGFTQATGSLPNTDPLLDPGGLQDNGGPTKTIALQPNSPAVDLVAQDACPPPQTDQRGIERPQGHSCDSGAFELEQDPQLTDTTAPKVEAVSPSNGKTGVARATNLSATFSERMDPASITKATFKLFKCPSTSSTSCTTQLTNVAISKSADGLRATLNPFGTSSTVLAPTTKYKAVVTTGAEDAAGNALDQNPSASGNQQKAWYFTTGG